jgi:hypothetical protein
MRGRQAVRVYIDRTPDPNAGGSNLLRRAMPFSPLAAHRLRGIRLAFFLCPQPGGYLELFAKLT